MLYAAVGLVLTPIPVLLTYRALIQCIIVAGMENILAFLWLDAAIAAAMVAIACLLWVVFWGCFICITEYTRKYEIEIFVVT